MNTPEFEFDGVPEWLTSVFKLLTDAWHNQSHNETVNWKISQDEDGWNVSIAPCFQELLGGESDGGIVWTPFIFDIGEFIKISRDVLVIKETAVSTSHDAYNRQPMVMIQAEGVETSESVYFSIYLEPPRNSGPREVIDMLKQEIRIKDTEDESDATNQ